MTLNSSFATWDVDPIPPTSGESFAPQNTLYTSVCVRVYVFECVMHGRIVNLDWVVGL